MLGVANLLDQARGSKAARARARRRRAKRLIRAHGLFDKDWYELQTGRTFASSAAAFSSFSRATFSRLSRRLCAAIACGEDLLRFLEDFQQLPQPHRADSREHVERDTRFSRVHLFWANRVRNSFGVIAGMRA